MNWQDILLVLGPVVAGFLGYFLRYYLDKKKEFTSKNAEIKREAYLDLVKIYIDLIKNTVTKEENKNEIDQNKLVNNLYEYYKKHVLYASPKVIKSFSNYMHLFYRAENRNKEVKPKAMLRGFSKVIKAMRKDIGLSNRGLGLDGQELLKAIYKDYDGVIK